MALQLLRIFLISYLVLATAFIPKAYAADSDNQNIYNDLYQLVTHRHQYHGHLVISAPALKALMPAITTAYRRIYREQKVGEEVFERDLKSIFASLKEEQWAEEFLTKLSVVARQMPDNTNQHFEISVPVRVISKFKTVNAPELLDLSQRIFAHEENSDFKIHYFNVANSEAKMIQQAGAIVKVFKNIRRIELAQQQSEGFSNQDQNNLNSLVQQIETESYTFELYEQSFNSDRQALTPIKGRLAFAGPIDSQSINRLKNHETLWNELHRLGFSVPTKNRMLWLKIGVAGHWFSSASFENAKVLNQEIYAYGLAIEQFLIASQTVTDKARGADAIPMAVKEHLHSIVLTLKKYGHWYTFLPMQNISETIHEAIKALDEAVNIVGEKNKSWLQDHIHSAKPNIVLGTESAHLSIPAKSVFQSAMEITMITDRTTVQEFDSNYLFFAPDGKIKDLTSTFFKQKLSFLTNPSANPLFLSLYAELLRSDPWKESIDYLYRRHGRILLVATPLTWLSPQNKSYTLGTWAALGLAIQMVDGDGTKLATLSHILEGGTSTASIKKFVAEMDKQLLSALLISKRLPHLVQPKVLSHADSEIFFDAIKESNQERLNTLIDLVKKDFSNWSDLFVVAEYLRVHLSSSISFTAVPKVISTNSKKEKLVAVKLEFILSDSDGASTIKSELFYYRTKSDSIDPNLNKDILKYQKDLTENFERLIANLSHQLTNSTAANNNICVSLYK